MEEWHNPNLMSVATTVTQYKHLTTLRNYNSWTNLCFVMLGSDFILDHNKQALYKG